MKRFMPLLVVSLALSAHAQECIKVDYQELKDYGDKELVSKYCSDKQTFTLNTHVSEFYQSSFEVSKTISDMKGMDAALDKWGKAAQSAKECKSEMDRALRLLAQKNMDEAAASSQCASLKTATSATKSAL